MTKFDAAQKLYEIRREFPIKHDGVEAIEEARELLLQIYIKDNHLHNHYSQRCRKCRQIFFQRAEEEQRDEYGITEYVCHCPNCGETYEWNDCYWR